MYHYRQVLVRMRQGESDRQIAATRLMGRRAAGKLRKQAERARLARPGTCTARRRGAGGRPAAAQGARAQVSSPACTLYRELIAQWWSEGINGTTIYAALQRNHHYTGSYSSVSRYLRALAAKTPRVTTVLEFAPAKRHKSISAKDPRSSMCTPAKSSRPGCSSWCWPGAVTSTPSWCATKASRPGSVVTGVRSSTSTACRQKSSSTTPSARSPKRATTIPGATCLCGLRRRLRLSHLAMPGRRSTKERAR